MQRFYLNWSLTLKTMSCLSIFLTYRKNTCQYEGFLDFIKISYNLKLFIKFKDFKFFLGVDLSVQRSWNMSKLRIFYFVLKVWLFRPNQMERYLDFFLNYFRSTDPATCLNQGFFLKFHPFLSKSRMFWFLAATASSRSDDVTLFVCLRVT